MLIVGIIVGLIVGLIVRRLGSLYLSCACTDGVPVKMVASRIFSTSSSFIVVAVVLLLAANDDVSGCSMPQGWRPMQPAEELYNANDALYGRVIDKKRDAERWIEVYTVTVEVYCILKGDPTPATVQVSDVGLYSYVV
jgi:hypothetical protein